MSGREPTPAERAAGALALALDLSDVDEALALVGELGGYFRTVKVGLELFCAAGPSIVEPLIAAGHDVFLDLKLHDIPTTVERAARVVGAIGVRYVTVHTAGGPAMVAAAAEGLRQGAHGAGRPPPIGLGVTVLTSDPTPPPALLAERARLASSGGLGGVVCAAPDLEVVRAAAPGLRTVVPGTRDSGWDRNDQQRVTTPADAIARGADLLVIGRGVTAAPDRVARAIALVESIDKALSARADRPGEPSMDR